MGHPIKDYEFRYDEGCTKVREMFELGRDAVALTAARKREKAKARAEKRPWKKTLHPCHALGNEYGVSPTLVFSARRAAEGFTDDDVEAILDGLYAAKLAPGLEHFRIWSTVPVQHRMKWVEQSIAERWNVEELKRRVLDRFERRSNGGKKPWLPVERSQATRLIDKARAKLQSIFEAVLTLPSLDEGPTSDQKTDHWRRLDRSLERLREDVNGVDWDAIDDIQSTA